MSDQDTTGPSQTSGDRPAIELVDGAKPVSSQGSSAGRWLRGFAYTVLAVAAVALLVLCFAPDVARRLPFLNNNRDQFSRLAEERGQKLETLVRGEDSGRSSNQEIKATIEELGGKWNSSTDKVSFDRTDVADDDLQILQEIQILLELGLADTQVSDAGLVHVAELKTLRDLDLTNTPVTDEGVRHLTKVPRFRSLNLAGTQVTDAVIEVLRELTGLRILNLAGTQVTDAGLMQLQEFTELTSLTLSLDPPTQAAIDELTAALPDCRIVVEE